MEIPEIKLEIEKYYQEWKKIPGGIEDFTTAEIYESAVQNLIVTYCESKKYEVEGFPFQKRILAETEEYYDEEYFNYWRYLKYIDVLATTKDDVLELLHFYANTFDKNLHISKEEYRNNLLQYIKINIYEVDF